MDRRTLLFAATLFLLGPRAVCAPVGCGTPNTTSTGEWLTTGPRSMGFGVEQGNSAVQAMSMNEISGGSADNWSASPLVGWLTLSVLSGAFPGAVGDAGSAITIVTANTGSMTPGTYNGGIVITPSRFCTSTIFGPTTIMPVTLTITATPPEPQVPVLAPNSAVNGASFRPATDPNGAIAPGAIVAIFGTDLAGDMQVATAVPLPTTLGDTSGTFNNIAAPLFFVSGTQINAQVPFELMTGTGSVTVQVKRGSETSTAQPIGVAAVSPGVFTLNQQGTDDGAILHANNFQPVSESAPALPGEFLLIFCTGLGLVQPEVQSGQIAPTAELTCLAIFGPAEA